MQETISNVCDDLLESASEVHKKAAARTCEAKAVKVALTRVVKSAFRLSSRIGVSKEEFYLMIGGSPSRGAD